MANLAGSFYQKVATQQNVENLYSTLKEMSTPLLKYENVPITFIQYRSREQFDTNRNQFQENGQFQRKVI